MEIEFWWLLALPLFFALGWMAARVDIRHVMKESRSLPRSYLNGLNFLLNEQPDKAIDAFIEAVRIDPDTVELHFALGSLFRRRGETERAIRMHQHLVDREDLNESQRLQALAELGQDYLKAGLLDRAESVFLRLRGTALNDVALRDLLEIYQQEKDWPKAIDIAKALPDHESVWWRKEMANFHCEMASDALADSRLDDAETAIQSALQINPRSVRGSLIKGDLAARRGDLDEAVVAWKRIEGQDPLYLSLAAERLMKAYDAQGRIEDGLQLLRAYLERHSSLDLLDVLFDRTLKLAGSLSAYDLVRDELRRNPSVLGLDKMLEAALVAAPTELRPDIELVRQLVHSHTRRVARYRCDSCGFKARQFYWRCPACGGWETTPPRRTEEYDLVP
ncbi:lipopolysaccharide assembly protein LapB [Denitromonas ohlonensis]|uniref:Lipopolysaccharide assembly protein B n=2 Tax=Denitromonas TaxID=139331 RepID=A0A558CP70_9RHOO|nr:lipopolysaccharide assembly protein LapB [Denitromonas ohlonensis]TVT50472.1 MAG: lipopolysaccharide assembly protein LapB [Denitromonas halophila]TVO59219.1 lipopolysaccharide assembly protein LapB [Denitromonas ohlonensis]TVO73390.1 lipopolysaccharide assembly protein LapB [Denitromonas ohlonensis]TVT72831.1 MAG: lipopolysaccharide assembly protein LapB [Denitromonas halophila]TVT74653.1 MAG: lipopolysaccharide assembly protein LapB [Denitromonas halophila]